MNGARATAGAPALTAAPGLRALALGWSTFMADGGTGGVLQHNPNVRAQLPTNGAASATAWAENVASWSPGTGRDAASVFGLYMNSPGHRANILNPTMRFVGIGDGDQRRERRLQHPELHQRDRPGMTPPAARPRSAAPDSLTVSGTNRGGARLGLRSGGQRTLSSDPCPRSPLAPAAGHGRAPRRTRSRPGPARSCEPRPRRRGSLTPTADEPVEDCRRTGWSTGAASTRSRQAGDVAC